MTGGFRMTEQGETIAQKYANLANGTFNLELLLAGASITTAVHANTPNEPEKDTFHDTFDFISHSSTEAYQKFLRTPGFIEFYRAATPIDALENSRIGSRPARRTGKKGHSISDLRAIPWVFSWTQARFYLPGWFGVGSALSALQQEQPDKFLLLKLALPTNAFLSYLLTNVETNLNSANLALMTEYSELVEDETIRHTFMNIVVDEFHRTRDALKELFDGSMESRRPRMAKTLTIREAPLAILHRQQISLLKDWRNAIKNNNLERAEEILPKLLLSINAIASGLRTTG
jgi:phosphoenolpyruvate carboxylase